MIKESAGVQYNLEGNFIARRRHIDALEKAMSQMIASRVVFKSFSGELLAEELRLAHNALAEITGKFSSDDLLGKIFSEFCYPT